MANNVQAVTTFRPIARVLHWTMAVMVLAMLLIGAGMVTSVSARHSMLVAIHKPLGIAVLVLVCLRIVVRLTSRSPALPGDLPAWQRLAAHGSHVVLYALMVAMPLVGWAMVSAGGYPVNLGGGIRLPAILPADPVMFAWLRHAHQCLAYLLFVTFLAHLGAALYHGLIRQDGVLRSMVGK